jgi:uncharacterized repeat protein (TIGR03803 family)
MVSCVQMYRGLNEYAVCRAPPWPDHLEAQFFRLLNLSQSFCIECFTPLSLGLWAVLTSSMSRTRWIPHAAGIGLAAGLLSGCNSSATSSTMPDTARVARSILAASSTSYGVLYSFGRQPDANAPVAALIDVKGAFYGTSQSGGVYPYSRYGSNAGTVFSVTSSGKEQVIYSFGNGKDGATPLASLLEMNGKLYGTTEHGGEYDRGTVFSMTRAGKEKVLHSFGLGTDGINPFAGLIDVNGTLYGTTAGGGTGCGAVYKISPSGSEKVTYEFQKAYDGCSPESALTNVDGKLYGTTEGGGIDGGGGTVFSVTTSGIEQVLHTFIGSGIDGYAATGPLLDVNGTLYGETYWGGAYISPSGCSRGCGTVFSITTGGSEQLLYSFRGRRDGEYPEGGLIELGGTLYGTTNRGGFVKRGGGTVFSITTSGDEKVMHRFGKGSDGGSPLAALLPVNETLYGTTSQGGSSNVGTVFESNALTKKPAYNAGLFATVTMP